MALGVAQAIADQTNLVQTLNIQFVGIGQGGAVTNKNTVTTSVETFTLGTQQVINALAVATGNTFSSNAKLVLVTTVGGGGTWFQIRDGNSQADVSSFFTYDQSSSVGSSQTNLKTGRSTSTEYSIQQLALVDSPYNTPLTLHFDVTGEATDSTTAPANAMPTTGTIIRARGAGDIGGSLLILRGPIGIEGSTYEPVQVQSD